MDLIAASGFRMFPRRLPSQPVFYPVVSEEYAIGIAQDWNSKDRASGFVGYVTRFKVRKQFLAQYEIHTVGGTVHQEYWIPAEDMGELNANIVGTIETIHEFRSRADGG
jgi:hypothetical protein